MTDRPLLPPVMGRKAKLTDPQLRGIGLVISEWGKTENSVYVAMTAAFALMRGGELSDAGALTLLMGSGMDSRTMLGLLRGFVRIHHPDRADEFDKLADRIGDEAKRRNIVAHADWRNGRRPNSIQTLAIRAVGEFRVDLHEFTTSEFERLAARIRAVRLELIDFMGRLGYYPPSRKKSSEPTPE